MTEGDRVGEATARRYVDRDVEAILVHVSIGQIFSAYRNHVRRWETLPDGLALVMMRQGLAATILDLTIRPRDAHVAWTINITEPPINLFLTGGADQSTVTGRVFTEGVKTTQRSRLFLEVSDPRKGASQSSIEVSGLDIIQIFDQYYAQSEQTLTRGFELDDEEFLLIQALPQADPKWFRSLDQKAARDLMAAQSEVLDTRTFAFRCGCSKDRMLSVIQAIYYDKPADLFKGEDGVEVFCPRCGRRWWIERESFGTE